MRTREKKAIFRRFLRGESVHDLILRLMDKQAAYFDARDQIEAIVRQAAKENWPGKEWL